MHCRCWAMSARQKVIIDCDAGTDDAQAIMMALASSQSIEVVAITTIFGNSFVEDTTRNVLRLLTFCGQTQIPVYKGCASCLTFNWKRTSPYYHGHDGFGDIMIDEVDPVDMANVNSENAAHALCRFVSQQPGSITLVCIGPLTNVAVALLLDNQFGKNLKNCVIMGGNYLCRGNCVGTSAEYNWSCDPEAAHSVLSGLQTDITIVPFETCQESYFSWNWYDSVCQLPNKTAQLLKRLDEHTVSILHNSNAVKYAAWDQLAMAFVINPSVAIDTVQVYATVELHGSLTRGQMVIDWNNRLNKTKNLNIVTKVDQELYQELTRSAFTLLL